MKPAPVPAPVIPPSPYVFKSMLAGAIRNGRREAWERRLPEYVRSAEAFPGPAYPRKREHALTMREIAPDSQTWIRSIKIDVDRVDAVEYVHDLVVKGSLPEASYHVQNARSGHSHVVWELGRWVRRDSLKAKTLFDRVRAALGDIIEGADPDYVGCFQHNPVHGVYAENSDLSTWGSFRQWELGDLVEFIGNERLSKVNLAARRRNPAIMLAAGRNSRVFEETKVVAYSAVHAYREANDVKGFFEYVDRRANGFNAMLESPLGVRECCYIANSVAEWTWEKYQGKPGKVAQPRADYLKDAAERRAEACRLKAEGLSVTAIAKQLNRSRKWASDVTKGIYAKATAAELVLEARRLERDGMPKADIAKRLGRSKRWVYAALQVCRSVTSPPYQRNSRIETPSAAEHAQPDGKKPLSSGQKKANRTQPKAYSCPSVLKNPELQNLQNVVPPERLETLRRARLMQPRSICRCRLSRKRSSMALQARSATKCWCSASAVPRERQTGARQRGRPASRVAPLLAMRSR